MKEYKNIGIILPNRVNEEPPFAFINKIFSEQNDNYTSSALGTGRRVAKGVC